MRYFCCFKTFLLAGMLVLVLCISGCGGDGVEDSATHVGAAALTLRVSPTRIDTGDVIWVRIEISDIDPQGVSLKIRYPLGLVYIDDSSFLESGDERFEISPQEEESDDTYTYLVFYITDLSFGGSDRGELVFSLEGESEVSSGNVEVDSDLDDPNTDNSVEFDVDDPDFTAQEQVSVQVRN